MKKTCLLWFIIFIIACHSEEKKTVNSIIGTDDIVEADEIELGYLTKLSKEVKVKQIFDYLIKMNYQKDFDYIYEFYGEKGIFHLGDAFKIVSQSENKFVYKNIMLIESYTFYGIPIEIHKIPNGFQGNYYLVVADISAGAAYEFLLFDEEYRYLDTYKFSTRYIPNRKLYGYKEIKENMYGILTILNGNYGLYLTFITIINNKFKEIFIVRISSGYEDDTNSIYDEVPEMSTN